jgi:hypothetical protein
MLEKNKDRELVHKKYEHVQNASKGLRDLLTYSGVTNEEVELLCANYLYNSSLASVSFDVETEESMNNFIKESTDLSQKIQEAITDSKKNMYCVYTALCILLLDITSYNIEEMFNVNDLDEDFFKDLKKIDLKVALLDKYKKEVELKNDSAENEDTES